MRQMLHGTAVAIGGHGVLLVGASGSGKSDLALRLIDRGAILISDDIVFLETNEGMPLLACAPNITGKIELRGVGICVVDFVPSAPLRLVVEFENAPDRLPSDNLRATIGEYLVPLCRLNPVEPSSPIKAEYALRNVVNASIWPATKAVIRAEESQLT